MPATASSTAIWIQESPCPNWDIPNSSVPKATACSIALIMSNLIPDIGVAGNVRMAIIPATRPSGTLTENSHGQGATEAVPVLTALLSDPLPKIRTVAAQTLGHYAGPDAVTGDGREEVTAYVRSRELAPVTLPGLQKLITSVAGDMAIYKELKHVPAAQTRNFRNDMYIISESLRMMDKAKQPTMSAADGTSTIIPTSIDSSKGTWLERSSLFTS